MGHLNRFSRLQYIYCIFFGLFVWKIKIIHAVQCNSCFTSCQLTDQGELNENCDCSSPTKCTGPACFSKVEVWEEDGIASIEMGCIDPLPQQGVGCQYASTKDTINCFCHHRDYCNNRPSFKKFRPDPLPTVECCSCTPGNDTCPISTCKDLCQGNYCFQNYLTGTQGCAIGYPEMLRFLRTSDYSANVPPATCVTYVAQGLNPIVHGCSCGTNECNIISTLQPTYTKAVGNFSGLATEEQYSLEAQQKMHHYCYGLQESSHTPIQHSAYKKSTTCQGHYCFVSLTTARIVLEGDTLYEEEFGRGEDNYYDVRQKRDTSIPRLEEYYELLAGCIRVDTKSKVTVGCTMEYHSDPSAPLVKHCICEGHLCNYHNLITGEDMKDIYAYEGPRRERDPSDLNGAINDQDTRILYSSNSNHIQINYVLLMSIILLYNTCIHTRRCHLIKCV